MKANEAFAATEQANIEYIYDGIAEAVKRREYSIDFDFIGEEQMLQLHIDGYAVYLNGTDKYKWTVSWNNYK